MESPSDATANFSRTRAVRVSALLLALFLHALAFQWADGMIGLPSLHGKMRDVVAMELKPAIPTQANPPQVPPAQAEKPLHRRRPKPQPAAPKPPEQSSQPESSIAAADPPPPAPLSAENPQPAAKQEVTPPVAEASAPPPPDTAGQGYKVAPPPPAELKYEVYAEREGQKWHGNGAFRWESSSGSYAVTGEASITFLFKITVLNFRSEGEIREFGIAPVLYSEKPFRKSLTNTHFQHANGKISFSASEATYPYKGGEQDRGSIIWQLAGIGRGDATQFAPGTAIDVVVAGNRDADTWHIRVIGEEEIDTRMGRMTAWHVSRAPRPGSYDQAIDIWFAPQHEWYPVKVRYTYVNGDFLDLSLSSLAPLAAQ